MDECLRYNGTACLNSKCNNTNGSWECDCPEKFDLVDVNTQSKTCKGKPSLYD